MKIAFMKYLFFLLLIFSCPGFLLAQKGKKKAAGEQYPGWFASGYFAFQNSNVRVREDENWDTNYKSVTFFQGGSGRAGGVQAGYGFNPKLDLLLGASFGKQSIVQTSNFPISFIDPTQYGATEQIGAHRFVTIHSLEVPIEARYKFLIGRAFSVYPSLGGLLVFTTHKKQDVEAYLDNGAVATHPANDFSLANDRPFNVAIQAKLGFRLQLAKPLFIKVEPFYKWYLAKEQLLTEFANTNLRSFGVWVGMEYVLGFQQL